MNGRSASARIYGETKALDTSSYFCYPRFKDPTLRDSYWGYSRGVPFGITAGFLWTIFYASVVVKTILLILKAFIYDLENNFHLVLSVFYFLAALFGFISGLVYLTSDRWLIPRPWKKMAFRLHYLLIAASHNLYYISVSLKQCETFGVTRTCKASEHGAYLVGVLMLAFAPSLYSYVASFDYDVATIVLVGGVMSQIYIYSKIGLEFQTGLSVFLLAVLAISCLNAMETSRMSSFVGTIHEKELRDMQRNFMEKEKSQLRAVLWNVAHDMKTPMQSFVAGLHVMQENPSRVRTLIDTSSDFKLKRDVEGVLRETSAAAQEMSASCELLMMQLNRAMDVSSLENDLQTEKPHLSVTPIREIANDVVRAISTLQCDKTNIRLANLPRYLSTHVMTARSWFADNLLCVVENAAKYSPPNSTVHVQLSVHLFEELRCFGAPNLQFGEGIKDEDKFLLVKVTDAGINDIKHGELFARITQSDRSVGGAGLGLYALRLRMVRLGGVCGSRPRQDGNHGSEFFFAVPYDPVDIEGKPWKSSNNCDVEYFDSGSVEREISRSDISTGNLSNNMLMDDGDMTPSGVLVVDDSLPTLKLITRAFKSAGIDVMTAVDGKQALDTMKSKLFSLVVMDIQMPVMDGIECIQLFRLWESKHEMRVKARQFIVAASAVAEYKAQCLEIGADEFQSKPVDMKILISIYKQLEHNQV